MKFSILTACYNKEKWISATAQSVLSQTYKDWEWIIVDDKSTDRSIAKLRSVVKHDRRVRVITPRNRLYCSAAYHNALMSASGEFCGILDADDILKPGAVDRMVQLYTKYPDIGYIYSQHNICDAKMRKMRRGVSSLPPEDKSFAEMAVQKVHCFSHWRTFRTNLKDRAVIFPAGLKSCVDKHMGLVLEELACGGFYNKVLYLYRWYLGGNISTAVNRSRRKNDSQKARWFRMASSFRKRRSKHNISTHPVIEVSL